jgi:molybdopterin-synthase adenylyltransferase
MEFARYHRQMLLPGIGDAGQRRLTESHALIVGCGALGSHIADALARAGVGALTVVDRDVVELTNLQRQVLYDEADVEAGTPKAEAAKARLRRINSQITVSAHVDDFNHRNAERFAERVDLIMDGLDNFETRYLLNDLAVSRGLPYIYGGAVGVTGVSLAVLPHHSKRQAGHESTVKWSEEQSTPCLRCVFPEAPPPGSSPTCDTAGVLGPVIAAIAAHQAAQAIKLLTGNLAALDRSLLSIDLWTNDLRRFDVGAARETSECPCCVQGRFEFLQGESGSATTSLCGRNAVQITPARSDRHIDLARLATSLAAHGQFSCTPFLLKGSFTHERNNADVPYELTVFPNGRAIIKGTAQPEVARTVYARYVGS